MPGNPWGIDPITFASLYGPDESGTNVISASKPERAHQCIRELEMDADGVPMRWRRRAGTLRNSLALDEEAFEMAVRGPSLGFIYNARPRKRSEEEGK